MGTEIKNTNTANDEAVIDTLFINGKMIPQYYGKPYVKIDNEPKLTRTNWEEDFIKENVVFFDNGTAYACIKKEFLLPEKRQKRRNKRNKRRKLLHSIKYDIVDGKYLYNECHLIACQLAWNSVNYKKNFIMGTRYMNMKGMLPFEEKVAKYVRRTGNRVLYRVTPIFMDNNYIASGVQMEALSIEDNEICCNIYAYNVQPGIAINYLSGCSKQDGEWCKKLFNRENVYTTNAEKGTQDYILNINTNIFHNPRCNELNHVKEENKIAFKYPRQFLVDNDCNPCKNCKP